jgi:hypothetical protein
MKKWKTRSGEEIPYEELSNSHLLNILKYIERRAEEGITIIFGSHGMSYEGDLWADKENLRGESVKRWFNYYELQEEANKRGLI